MQQRTSAAVAFGATAALLATAPRPTAALAALTAPSPADPLAPVVAAATLAAWLLAGWLLVVCLLTLGEQLPGLLGCAAGALVRRLAPVTVRRAVAVVLGVTLSAGALGSTAASASPGAPGARADRAAASLDWPSPRPPAVAPPTLDWAPPAAGPPAARPPATHTAAAPPPAARHGAPGTADVVVAPGDSLWAIAADQLAAGGRLTDDAQVARAWPSWWAANRDVIGPNPDLIQPGTHLDPPPSGTS